MTLASPLIACATPREKVEMGGGSSRVALRPPISEQGCIDLVHPSATLALDGRRVE
jgi:hypothetical protein